MMARLCEMLCEAESQHARGDSTSEREEANGRSELKGQHVIISTFGGR